jgi:hypothetical protein
MAAPSTTENPLLRIVTVKDLQPSPSVQPTIVLRSHQKAMALCFTAVGLIATAGWLYFIVLAFRALAVSLIW